MKENEVKSIEYAIIKNNICTSMEEKNNALERDYRNIQKHGSSQTKKDKVIKKDEVIKIDVRTHNNYIKYKY
jgi:hypothetical protein